MRPEYRLSQPEVKCGDAGDANSDRHQVARRPFAVVAAAEVEARDDEVLARRCVRERERECAEYTVHPRQGHFIRKGGAARPDLVSRVVIINSWMWSFTGDRDMESKGRIAGSAFGRFLYRWANLSIRVLAPSAYGDRRKLTPPIHQQYLDRFPDRWSRGAVLWPLARAILGSAAFYDSLWRDRAKLGGLPALIIWGMKDTAFRPHQLARWREALPNARVVELPDAGHWPHEEAPDEVAEALRGFMLAA